MASAIPLTNATPPDNNRWRDFRSAHSFDFEALAIRFSQHLVGRLDIRNLHRSGIPIQFLTWKASSHVAELKDINTRETIMLSLLAAAVLLLGLWPDPLTSVMHATVDNLLQHVIVSKL